MKKKNTQKKLTSVYELLLDHFGHRKWWPADTPFEVCVGAILTQNTNWKNVESAISNLKDEGWLDIDVIRSLPHEQLASCIRPAGYYNLKTKRLKALTDYLHEKGGSDLSGFDYVEDGDLRTELLAVYGVGPETADSIMLYALNRTVFVVDTYTRRIFARLGHCPVDASYQAVQNLFLDNLPHERQLFDEYHALIVGLGANFCKPRPLCKGCPLDSICPKNGL